jgi:hypothetical protein
MWIDSDFPFPVSSYVEKVEDPGTDPRAMPLVCLQINASWQPYMAGALTQLVNPATWDEPSPAALSDVLARATDLISIVALAGVCTAVQIRYTPSCQLEYSLDGGTTWIQVDGWNTYFKSCVIAAGSDTWVGPIVMVDGSNHPPVPVWNEAGDDWIYAG